MTISQVPLGEVPMKSTNENTRIIGRKNLYSDGNGQSSTNNVAFATNVKGQVRFAEVERFGGRRQPFKLKKLHMGKGYVWRRAASPRLAVSSLNCGC